MLPLPNFQTLNICKYKTLNYFLCLSYGVKKKTIQPRSHYIQSQATALNKNYCYLLGPVAQTAHNN